MPNIALADVSVNLIPQRFFNPPGKPNEAYPTLEFGDGVLKYDTYGIPVPPPGDFGMLNEILRIFIQDPPDGYKYVYDPTPRAANPVAPNGTIRIFESDGVGTITFDALAAHTHDLRVIGGITADEDVGILASGPTLGKLAATNRVIAGADQATKGGVVGASAGTPSGTGGGTTGPMVELGNVVVPATSLELIVIGQ